MGNENHYEWSEATDTNHSNCEKEPDNIKYKEGFSTIEDTDSLVYFLSNI